MTVRWPIFNYGPPKTWLGRAMDSDPVAMYLIICFVVCVTIVTVMCVGSLAVVYIADPPTNPICPPHG